MEVDNQAGFLDESEDTGDDTPKTTNKHATRMTRKAGKMVGKSNTIRMGPIPRSVAEADIYAFIKEKCKKKAQNIRLTFSKLKRYSTKSENPLFDAQVAYVVMESNDDAALVYKALDGAKFNGFDIHCSVASNTKSDNSKLKGQSNWVAITGLKKSVTEQDILTHIQQHGSVKKAPRQIFLSQHPRRNNYLGSAHIELSGNSDAAKCVKNLNGTSLSGRKLWCAFKPIRKTLDRKESEFGGKTKLVLIGNMHWSVKDTEVRAMCEDFGEVDNVQIWYDQSGYTRGMAIVVMGDNESATKVFEGLNGKKVKNLVLRTAYTKKQFVSDKDARTKQKQSRRKKTKKKLMKSKGLVKKMGNLNVTKDGKTSKKERLDGVGSGGKKVSNTTTGFKKKSKRGKNMGKNRGPKFA